MKGELVVTFDFLNEKGERIIKEECFNTLSVDINKENVIPYDYIDFKFWLIHQINCFLLSDESQHLCPHSQIAVKTWAQHYIEKHISD